MKKNSDEIKIAAVRVFSIFDKRQALSFVETMINSIKSEQRRQAIFCAGQFDFPSVCELLLKSLKKESDTENVSQIVTLLKMNSSEDLFFRLHEYWKDTQTSRSESFKDACDAVGIAIIEADESNYSHINKLFAEGQKRYDQENKLKAQRSTYKLEKIQKIRNKQDNVFKVDASFVRFTIVAYLIGFVLTVLIWFLILAPSEQSKKVVAKRIIVKKMVSKIFIIRGTVTGIDEKAQIISIMTLKKKNYAIKVNSSWSDIPAVGAEFQGQIKVLKKNEKTIHVELISMF